MVVVVAFVLRAGFLITREPDPVSRSDAAVFDELGWSLARGGGYADHGRPDASREPGYPLFLAGIYAAAGHHAQAVRWTQALVGVIIVGLTWFIGIRIWAPPVAAVASVAAAADPFLIGSDTLLLTETWFTFVLLLALWFLVTRWQSVQPRDWLLAGCLLGYATLVRGTMLLFPTSLAAAHATGQRWKAARGLMGIFLLGFLLIYTPWVVRNYAVFHAFIPVRIGSGEVVWSGNYLPWDGDWRGVLPPLTTLIQGLDPIEADHLLLWETWKSIRSNPGAYPALYLRKIPKLWLGIPGTTRLLRDSPGLIRMLDVAWVFVIIAMLAGIVLSYGRYPQCRLLLGLLVYFTLVHMPLDAIPRYRLPLHPVVYLFAAVPLVAIAHRWGLIKEDGPLRPSPGYVVSRAHTP